MLLQAGGKKGALAQGWRERRLQAPWKAAGRSVSGWNPTTPGSAPPRPGHAHKG